jgi:hypothetical protein
MAAHPNAAERDLRDATVSIWDSLETGRDRWSITATSAPYYMATRPL